jgi:hypothetical protein
MEKLIALVTARTCGASVMWKCVLATWKAAARGATWLGRELAGRASHRWSWT